MGTEWGAGGVRGNGGMGRNGAVERNGQTGRRDVRAGPGGVVGRDRGLRSEPKPRATRTNGTRNRTPRGSCQPSRSAVAARGARRERGGPLPVDSESAKEPALADGFPHVASHTPPLQHREAMDQTAPERPTIRAVRIPFPSLSARRAVRTSDAARSHTGERTQGAPGEPVRPSSETPGCRDAGKTEGRALGGGVLPAGDLLEGQRRPLGPPPGCPKPHAEAERRPGEPDRNRAGRVG